MLLEEVAQRVRCRFLVLPLKPADKISVDRACLNLDPWEEFPEAGLRNIAICSHRLSPSPVRTVRLPIELLGIHDFHVDQRDLTGSTADRAGTAQG